MMIEYHQERWSDMQYDKEFKLQALELSDEIGVKAAAEQLGIKYYTLAVGEVSVRLAAKVLLSEAAIK